VRLEPKTIGIAAIMHDNCHAMSSMPFPWQTDLFLWIASCHETESSTGGTNNSSRWVVGKILVVK